MELEQLPATCQECPYVENLLLRLLMLELSKVNSRLEEIAVLQARLAETEARVRRLEDVDQPSLAG